MPKRTEVLSYGSTVKVKNASRSVLLEANTLVVLEPCITVSRIKGTNTFMNRRKVRLKSLSFHRCGKKVKNS